MEKKRTQRKICNEKHTHTQDKFPAKLQPIADCAMFIFPSLSFFALSEAVLKGEHGAHYVRGVNPFLYMYFCAPPSQTTGYSAEEMEPNLRYCQSR